MAPLPTTSLRLPLDALELLAQLGIERIEQLIALPRDSLLARFGPRVLERLDQALGLLPEVVTPLRFVPPVQAAFAFESPIDNLVVVNRVLDQLTERLQQLLAARNRGARQVECWLYHEIASPWKVEIGLVRPSCSARRLSELLRIRLERVQIEEPITALWLRVTAAEALADRQEGLPFEDEGETGGRGDRETEEPRSVLPFSRSPAPPFPPSSSLPLAALLEHLSSRLGPAAVTRAVLVPDPQPEYACGFEAVIEDQSATRRAGGVSPPVRNPAAGRLHNRGANAPRSPVLEYALRPLHLCPRPIPIEALAIVPEGPPVRLRWPGHDHVVLRAWGPERIETGWWRGEDVQRDYYLVATRTGSRFWIFRRRDDGRWFLQGVFD